MLLFYSHFIHTLKHTPLFLYLSCLINSPFCFYLLIPWSNLYLFIPSSLYISRSMATADLVLTNGKGLPTKNLLPLSVAALPKEKHYCNRKDTIIYTSNKWSCIRQCQLLFIQLTFLVSWPHKNHWKFGIQSKQKCKYLSSSKQCEYAEHCSDALDVCKEIRPMSVILGTLVCYCSSYTAARTMIFFSRSYDQTTLLGGC